MERPRSYTDAVAPEITTFLADRRSAEGCRDELCEKLSFTEMDDDEEEIVRKRTIPFYSCYQCDLYLYCCQRCCLINYCETYPSDPDFHRDPMEDRIKEYREPMYSSYKSCCYRRVCGCVSRVYEDEESFHVCFGFLSCFVFAPFIGGLLCSL